MSVKKRNDVELIQLIERTLSGKTEAFGELIRRYQDAVYATALHYTSNFTEAQLAGHPTAQTSR